MKFNYQDHGAVASLTITSTAFEFRRHNRAVDAALLSTSSLISERKGCFFMKSVLTGRTPEMMRAYKVAGREAAR
ncbi:hypothetical protein NG99_17050 [Erwinia typographi]|uniref:Uncharacterized protein n=1 Tax=Erwinia typographi TaxID=371042 RepID=A0A0A3Z0V9_9GAMM|nr:hypothetical protein [Erwinia typographi]KGT91271.1 hypothetical protein NG99_17050 [Erwinia typographi]